MWSEGYISLTMCLSENHSYDKHINLMLYSLIRECYA
jgi:hypothetical protein